jgi:D-psicose/D-tagatose/L-ribulose 3-epimerase
MNKIGIYAAYWLENWRADIPFFISKVANLGFDVLEVPAGQLPDMTDSELAAVLREKEKHSIELTFNIGFPADKDLSSEQPEIQKAGIAYAQNILSIIHRLGGTIFCGINYASWPGPANPLPRDKRPALERSRDCLKEIVKTAEDYGILYCLEVVNRFEHYLINTAAEGLALIGEVGSPNLRLLLDTFHMNIEEDSLSQAILSAGSLLGHFHAGEPNRKLPGMGRMPWQEIARALKQVDYQGVISMEPFIHMGGEIGRDIRVWRELFDVYDEKSLDEAAKKSLNFIRQLMA